ncbi:alpha/beta fold hydrolase [bacterium]|nr:alpha/beta fold hydrolase [bacterium]
MRKLPIFFALLILAGCGSVNDPVEENFQTLYWAIEENGVLRGVASRHDEWCACDSKSFISQWTTPREHYVQSCSIEYQRQSGLLASYDWILNNQVTSGGGDGLRGRIAPEAGGDYAWLATGWGELDLRRHLAPAAQPPIPLDPRSPFSFELLAATWDNAGRPDSLDLSILRIGDPREIQDPMEVRLYHEGALDAGGFPVLGFHLTGGDETLHFKTFSNEFPVLWASLAWGFAMQYLGESGLNIEAFSPTYPDALGYSKESVQFQGSSGLLQGNLLLPDGTGPFPGVLALSGGGLVDRNQGALLSSLSHELAQAGYAVLIYDKPGVGESEGELAALGLEARQENLDTALDFLAAHEHVDTERISLLGYGEGGALALEGARRLEADAVVALSPWMNRPEDLAAIPEAVDDLFMLMDLTCYGSKYLDRSGFDPALYLPPLDIPVLLCAATWDRRNSSRDVHDQIDMILQGDADLDFYEYDSMSAAYNYSTPDSPVDAQVAAEIITWLTANLP